MMTRTSRGSGRDPWSDLTEWQRQLGGLLWPTGTTGEYPPLCLHTSNDHSIVTAELPGMTPDQLDIDVLDDTVTIRGRKQDSQHEKFQVIQRERGQGGFARTIRLPYRIAAANVEASIKNGILTLTLPRAEEDKARKIQVQA